MILPHKETIEIGHGFSLDIEIKDSGPDPEPALVSDWARDIDIPSVEAIARYPIDLLKILNKDFKLPWRVSISGGTEPDYLFPEWGHPIVAPDPRATTHRHGAHKFKTASVATAAANARKGFILAAERIKSFLDYRMERLRQRQETLKKAREGVGSPEIVSDKESGRADLLELDIK